MANRVVNGNTHSEDGWPLVDQGSCTWIIVPGTNPPVHLQIQNGQPLILLRAWAADWNAYIEPLRDADSACWTATNDVLGTPGENDGSNHLGGTAIDLNWQSHPFRQRGSLNAAQMAVMKEMEDFYEGTVFWAGRWNNPADEMHSQCGYNSFNNPHTQDFINRKIRADGFSTFRRGGTGAPPPPPPPASNQVDVLVRATGVSAAKAQEILVGVVNGLRDSQCNNVNRIAMWLAQIGHESAGFNATEEYQSGDESTDRWKYKGRTWIQITWRSNYAGLSEWAFGKGLIPSPTYFVDNPRKLAEIQYAGLGPAWYWTVARPQINSLCDNRDLVAVTQAINGGQNGAADRANRYERALALGDQLLVLTSTAPPIEEGFLMALSDSQQRELYDAVCGQRPSKSPLRPLAEGNNSIGALRDVVGYIDGSGHWEAVKAAAELGHPKYLADLREVAGADPSRYPDRQEDAKLAQAILADIEAKKQPFATATVQSVDAPPPQIVYVDRPAPEPVAQPVALAETNGAAVETKSTGQIIGAAYDALQQLRLADALPIEDRAPLAALIAVLQTKNGSELGSK